MLSQPRHRPRKPSKLRPKHHKPSQPRHQGPMLSQPRHKHHKPSKLRHKHHKPRRLQPNQSQWARRRHNPRSPSLRPRARSKLRLPAKRRRPSRPHRPSLLSSGAGQGWDSDLRMLTFSSSSILWPAS